MTLNIKNPKAYELARKLSAMTGISMTQVIINALQHEIERAARQSMDEAEEKKLDTEERKRRVYEIIDSFRQLKPRDGLPPLSTANMDDGLYDEAGLPI